jgi:pimeloyl-ACP methyl ester carboxylesterase
VTREPSKDSVGTAFTSVERVRLDSGRHVAVRRLASGSGARTIVLCHPAPGSGAFDPRPELTATRDVTLLAVDRPGYGGSDPLERNEWATVAGAADDLAGVLDTLRISSVGVAGWSAGGRVALALAARRPDLVDRVAVLATPAPNDVVPWMPAEQTAEVAILQGCSPEEVHGILEQQFATRIPAESYGEAALALLSKSAADDDALTADGVRERLGVMLAEAFTQGVQGVAQDVAGYLLRPWGFEPGAVQAKTLLLYGTRDPVAGLRHANWWLKQLPHARVEMAPGAGHLLIVLLWERVLSHLAPRTKK